ncbi:MAG: right-handed parallel beta-helix repeat-containing protein [Paludibacter sp.]
MTKQLSLIGILLFISHLILFGQGSNYAGPYTTSSPIVWSGISNQTISGLAIQNASGHSISLTNCSNITIQRCKLGPSLREGVYLYNCTNIKIVDCSIENVETGLYAANSSTIKFINNDVKNVKGPYPKGQMAQFDKINGPGNSISYNVCENIQGESNPEDVISMYMTNGTPTDRVMVVGNWIRGGGPSTSGGGIMSGDNGGSYVLIKDNILVNPGQYGIAIASGNHISIRDNKVYSEKKSYTNVGIYAYNQYPFECTADTIMNNTINWTNKDGVLWNTWTDNSCGAVVGWATTNLYDKNLNASVLPTQIIGRAKTVVTESVTPEVKTTEGKCKVYPNPAVDNLTIETDGETSNATIEIFDLKGQKVIGLPLNEKKTEININFLKVGIYIAKISGDNQLNEVKKIMIGAANGK